MFHPFGDNMTGPSRTGPSYRSPRSKTCRPRHKILKFAAPCGPFVVLRRPWLVGILNVWALEMPVSPVSPLAWHSAESRTLVANPSELSDVAASLVPSEQRFSRCRFFLGSPGSCEFRKFRESLTAVTAMHDMHVNLGAGILRKRTDAIFLK